MPTGVALPAAVALLVVVALLAGCSRSPRAATGPVLVTLPTPGPAAAAATCARLVAALPSALPEEVGGQHGRPVRDGAGRAAAWGDPAVTLVCGTPPAPDDAELFQVGPKEGGLVTFAQADAGPATTFTTVGLAVPVTITVPDAYDGTLLVPLTSVLLAQDR